MSTLPDDLPPCLIKIDKEGRMFHQGAEMIHQDINSLLLENLSLDAQGRFVIEFKGQRCFVEVEDTPLVVRRVSLQKDGGFSLSLSDGSVEELNPHWLWISEENVLYTRVRGGSLPARFLRPAYYQLAEHIQETDSGFALLTSGQLWPIKPGRPESFPQT